MFGVSANTYMMSQDDCEYKVSIMEEEEEHSNLSVYNESQEYLNQENFFEGYIITSYNTSNTLIPYLQAYYEDVHINCIETPPDFII